MKTQAFSQPARYTSPTSLSTASDSPDGSDTSFHWKLLVFQWASCGAPRMSFFSPLKQLHMQTYDLYRHIHQNILYAELQKRRSLGFRRFKAAAPHEPFHQPSVLPTSTSQHLLPHSPNLHISIPPSSRHTPAHDATLPATILPLLSSIYDPKNARTFDHFVARNQICSFVSKPPERQILYKFLLTVPSSFLSPLF